MNAEDQVYLELTRLLEESKEGIVKEASESEALTDDLDILLEEPQDTEEEEVSEVEEEEVTKIASMSIKDIFASEQFQAGVREEWKDFEANIEKLLL